MAAVIHLRVRQGIAKGQRAPNAKTAAHLLDVIQSPRARPAWQILAGDKNKQTEPEQSQRRHLRDDGIADGAADVVKVDVDAVGTALLQLGCNIL